MKWEKVSIRRGNRLHASGSGYVLCVLIFLASCRSVEAAFLGRKTHNAQPVGEMCLLPPPPAHPPGTFAIIPCALDGRDMGRIWAHLLHKPTVDNLMATVDGREYPKGMGAKGKRNIGQWVELSPEEVESASKRTSEKPPSGSGAARYEYPVSIAGFITMRKMRRGQLRSEDIMKLRLGLYYRKAVGERQSLCIGESKGTGKWIFHYDAIFVD